MGLIKTIIKFLPFLLLTLMIILDFFPDSMPYLSKPILIGIVVLFIIFGIYLDGNNTKLEKLALKERLFIDIYFISLIVVLTLIVGDKSTTFSITNPILLIILGWEIIYILK